MGINSPLHGKLIDPVWGSVITERGSHLDADLALLVVDADAELIRPAFGAWHGVSQTRVRHVAWSCSDPYEMRGAELLRSAWDIELLRLAYDAAF